MRPVKTRLLSLTDSGALSTAERFLKAGKLVVFPTDTLYGLGCDPSDPRALLKVYRAKARSNLKALPVLIGELHQLGSVATGLQPWVIPLIKQLWPGAITLILPKAPGLPPELTPYDTIAVRMPDHPFALRLLCQTGPLAVTSANLSRAENPTSAAEVLEQLQGRVHLILDGGRLRGGQASTIINCTTAEPQLVREGPISLRQILEKMEHL